MEVRSHIVVRGLVQGVGFRWFVHRKAAALGLEGWVQNAADGSVAIEAQGDRSLVEDLLREVKVGPRSAQVTDLQVEWLAPVHPGTPFHIR
jgi:acylphosphatase